MDGYIDSREIPVFIINGFLEGGKTSFISYTLNQSYFHISGKTLLIVTEEGIVSYDEKMLIREHVVKVIVDEKELICEEKLAEMNALYSPERVLIEYNGMWGDPGELVLPQGWVLYQQLTVMDGSTLKMYLANMKPLMGPMLKNSELLIVTRCDGIAESVLLDFKMKLRPMLPSGSAVVMENRFGEIELEVLDEELPYDVSGPTVVIPDEDFGIWYIDARDYPARYRGKKVEFTAQIMKSEYLGPGEFIPVRTVMTCCEADMRPLGYIAHYSGIASWKMGDWVRVLADFREKNHREYGGEGPYLEVVSLKRTGAVNEPVGF